MADLPAPSSGQLLEVSFRRLLQKCEEVQAGDDKGKQELQEWATSSVFHHYVETLQDQLSDLETSKRISENILLAYKDRVHLVALQLKRPKVPSFCGAKSQQETNLRIFPETTSIPEQSVEPSCPSPVASPRQSTAIPPTVSAESPRRAVLSTTTQQKLQTHMNLQEDLTDELLALATSLKTNTQGFESSLKKREKLLTETEDLMALSTTATRKATADAKTIHQKNRVNFCTTCLVLVAVGLVFVGMYMFIKTTSFLGYRKLRVPKGPVLQREL